MGKKDTLLQKAISIQKNNTQKKTSQVQITRDHVELSLVFLKGEVKITNIATALDSQIASTYIILARSLREAYKQGIIKIIKK